ncbi:MAG: hypothetical protein K2H53_02575, partial [Clostridia bacterium]|nr:hypothetical protein [Clostridia bacterium]
MTNTVKAAEPSFDPDTGYVLNGSQKCFFANGNELSITARDDGQNGATIFWADGTKHVDVPSDVNVFGGGHADTTTYENTKITMNGGTVKNIFGGGLHESYVTASEVIVNNGTVTGSIVGGGANVLAGSDNCVPASASASSSPTRVVNAIVSVNNGSSNNVYGGGEGISYTGNAKININGGTFQYVTAGGSNGYTGNTEVEITSGQINVLQSVNRGEVVSSIVEVLGGTIQNLYVGGENAADVTGTIESVSLDIAGGSVVQNLYMGTSGGQIITANSPTRVDVDIYLGATVNIADASEFDGISVTQYVLVTINDVDYELENGKTLADLAELPAIKNVEGKDFVKFVIKDTEE